MSRDVHVQFCEKLTGQFRWFTLPLILIETKRQYTKARKRMFKILKELKLKISPHKTKMGILKQGKVFHYLGVDFEVSRNLQRETQEATETKEETTVTIDIHPRTSRRALDRVKAMREDAVHPAHIQRYLSKWATWWYSVTRLERFKLIFKWVKFTEFVQQELVWLGSGLLLGSPYYCLTSISNQNQKQLLS